MAVDESQEGPSMTRCGIFCRREVFWPDEGGKQHCLHPGSYYSYYYRSRELSTVGLCILYIQLDLRVINKYC